MARLQSVRLGVVSGLIVALVASEHATAAEIQVNGPRSCSRGTELEARVERALGRSLSELGDVRCTVQVVRDGGSYVARVEMSSTLQEQSRQRSFSAKTCPKLMETLELAVVLAVGADGDLPEDDSSGQPVSASGLREQPGVFLLARQRSRRSSSNAMRSSPSDAAPTSDAAPLAKEAPVSKAQVAFTAATTPSTSLEREPAVASPAANVASAPFASSTADTDIANAEPEAEGAPDREALWRGFGGVVLDTGALPGPALGAQLGGSFGSELELRVLGTYLLPRRATVAGSAANTGQYGVDFTLATASVFGCAPRLAHPGSVELGVCAGGELGGLLSSGSALPRGGSTQTPWSALRADVGARWEVGRSWLDIEARLGLSVPLSRPRFTMSALDTSGSGFADVYRPSAIGARLSVAAVFALDGSR